MFDIDRTIYDGSIGEDLILSFTTQGIIGPKIIASLGLELIEYEISLTSYSESVKKILSTLEKELTGKDIEKISKEIKKFIRSNHYKFYDYVYEISKIFEKEFEVVLCSLEPDFLVSEIAKHLKIKHFICNQFKHKKTFLGDSEIITSKKNLFEKSLYKNHKIYAYFGDSENDFEMFEMAENKFVINPTLNLLNRINKDSKYKFITEKNAFQVFSKTRFYKH
jgi:phosphoserine phosphatase